MKVLIALVAALAIGVAIAASGNPTLLGLVDPIVPIGALWINAIRMTVIPLIFTLLITGVASASDMSAIGRIGGRTILVCFLLLVGVALVSMAVGPLVFAERSTFEDRFLLPLGRGELAELKPLGGEHVADFNQRGFAEILAGQELLLGGFGQVAERHDAHFLQAVAAPDRQLEVGHRHAEDLGQPIRFRLDLR